MIQLNRIDPQTCMGCKEELAVLALDIGLSGMSLVDLSSADPHEGVDGGYHYDEADLEKVEELQYPVGRRCLAGIVEAALQDSEVRRELELRGVIPARGGASAVHR